MHLFSRSQLTTHAKLCWAFWSQWSHHGSGQTMNQWWRRKADLTMRSGWLRGTSSSPSHQLQARLSRPSPAGCAGRNWGSGATPATTASSAPPDLVSATPSATWITTPNLCTGSSARCLDCQFYAHEQCWGAQFFFTPGLGTPSYVQIVTYKNIYLLICEFYVSSVVL